MSIKDMNRNAAEELRAKLQAVMDAFGKDHDVKLQIGNIKYTPGMSIDFKTTVVPTTATGKVDVTKTPEGVAFTRYAATIGLKPTDLEKPVVRHRGELFAPIGYKTRSPRMPLLARRVSDGKVYKLDPRFIERVAS